MELWDIYDESRTKTGKTVKRGQAMAQNEYHLMVHVWIKNSNNQYLISKRTANKNPFPLMWEATGGCATAGDSSLEAALREVKEELGVTLNAANGRCVIKLKRQDPNHPNFLDVYLFNQDIKVSNIVYQEDEVCDAKLATKDEIFKMINNGEFVSAYSYLNDLFNL